jgi:hypothetical protein
MIKDFNLSEKIYDIEVCPIYTDERRVINVYHIKEFIQLLKRIFPNDDVPIKSSEINETLDKLAGEKLI